MADLPSPLPGLRAGVPVAEEAAMRVRNTSQYPDSLVKSLVQFAGRGIGTTGVVVNVKNSSSAYAGMAYDGVPGISPVVKMKTSQYLITVRIGDRKKFPTSPYRVGKTAPEMFYADWREALVAVAAHEFRHIYQYRHGKRRSEVDAERHGNKRLEAYRLILSQIPKAAKDPQP